MQENKLPSNSQYVIVTVKEPVMFHQTNDETWLFNPNRRYVLNAARIPALHSFIESVSELDNSSLLNPLRAGKSVAGAKILVERFRERGIGDLLFLSGPLSYIEHVSGGTSKVDLFAYADRGPVLTHSSFLNNSTVLCGPIEYDQLRMYNYHWLVGSATECDEEPDQLNVYDALFKQLGFEPSEIDARWKRPSATLVAEDYKDLDRVFETMSTKSKLDLRKIPYYVVAPFSNATLRCANYLMWLRTIQQLAARRPVVVIGSAEQRLPVAGIHAGQFIEQLAGLGSSVINMIDLTPGVRHMMALISRAKAVVCLDSGPLYVAQALRTPAISLWGTHDPGVRIGYDPDYMRYAIWNTNACRFSPCYAYSQFPAHKCPNGDRQEMCDVLDSINCSQVMDAMDRVEKNSTR